MQNVINRGNHFDQAETPAAESAIQAPLQRGVIDLGIMAPVHWNSTHNNDTIDFVSSNTLCRSCTFAAKLKLLSFDDEHPLPPMTKQRSATNSLDCTDRIFDLERKDAAAFVVY